MAPSIVERTSNYSVNIEMVMGVPGDDQYFLECSRIACTVGQTECLSGIPTILTAVQDVNGTKVFQEWGNWDFTRDITSIHVWIPNDHNKYRNLAAYNITPESDMNTSIWTQVRRDLLDDAARAILRRDVPIIRVHLDRRKAEAYLRRLNYRVEGRAPTLEPLTSEEQLSGRGPEKPVTRIA